MWAVCTPEQAAHPPLRRGIPAKRHNPLLVWGTCILPSQALQPVEPLDDDDLPDDEADDDGLPEDEADDDGWPEDKADDDDDDE